MTRVYYYQERENSLLEGQNQYCCLPSRIGESYCPLLSWSSCSATYVPMYFGWSREAWLKIGCDIVEKIRSGTGTCFIQKIYAPPLPYFKVNFYPFPLPHFASIFIVYLWSFRCPNYIVTLPRYFSFRLPHLTYPEMDGTFLINIHHI